MVDDSRVGVPVDAPSRRSLIIIAAPRWDSRWRGSRKVKYVVLTGNMGGCGRIGDTHAIKLMRGGQVPWGFMYLCTVSFFFPYRLMGLMKKRMKKKSCIH